MLRLLVLTTRCCNLPKELETFLLFGYKMQLQMFVVSEKVSD